MNFDLFSMIIGIMVSLIFSYVPGVATRFNALTSTQKSLVMLVLALVVAASIFGLSCGKIIDSVTCDLTGIKGLAWIFISYLIANQTTHVISPKIGAKA